MKLKIGMLIIGLLVATEANAGTGFSVGTGVPYQTEVSLLFLGDKFGLEVGYNTVTITSGNSSASLTKPEVGLRFRPFSGSFFLGVAFGQQSLVGEASDAATGEKAKVEIVSMTVTPSLGWMWGLSDGGFFAGLDFGYQSPSSPKTTITSSLPTTNQAYLDAVKQGEDLGKMGFPLFTLIRLGWMF